MADGDALPPWITECGRSLRGRSKSNWMGTCKAVQKTHNGFDNIRAWRIDGQTVGQKFNINIARQLKTKPKYELSTSVRKTVGVDVRCVGGELAEVDGVQYPGVEAVVNGDANLA